MNKILAALALVCLGACSAPKHNVASATSTATSWDYSTPMDDGLDYTPSSNR